MGTCESINCSFCRENDIHDFRISNIGTDVRLFKIGVFKVDQSKLLSFWRHIAVRKLKAGSKWNIFGKVNCTAVLCHVVNISNVKLNTRSWKGSNFRSKRKGEVKRLFSSRYEHIPPAAAKTEYRRTKYIWNRVPFWYGYFFEFTAG